MVQKKASEMDELGLTNEELVVIIKKVAEERSLTYERILEALIRKRKGTLHPEDYRIRNFL